MEEAKMEERLLTSELVIYGKTIRTSNATYEGIEQLWQTVTTENLQNELFGVYHKYESDKNGAYSLTVGGPKMTVGYDEFIIPKGKYIVFKAETNDMLGVQNAWKTIWEAKDLERTYTVDFEWYHLDGTIEIYIAIK